jgi:hypothetical protein
MKNLILTFCIVLFSLNPLFSQENDNDAEHNSEIHEEHFHKHAVSLIMSHTHIASGIKDGASKWLIVPSIGINYNYNINEKWAIGLHNDLIIEEFEVEDPNSGNHDHEAFYKGYEEPIAKIERHNPISSAIMVSYKPIEHLALMAGGGMEFSSGENFGVIRFGLEAPFHIPHNWEVLGSFAYDININAYNSFTLGIGIAKLF